MSRIGKLFGLTRFCFRNTGIHLTHYYRLSHHKTIAVTSWLKPLSGKSSLLIFTIQNIKMIKKIGFGLLVCCSTLLASCLDTEEKIVIKNDNSGIYSLSIDMSKMIAMAKQMGAPESDKMPDKVDSIIYFKHFVDTAKNLSQKEKEMLRDGTMHMQLDEDASKMNIQFNIPFKNISQLPEIRSSYFAALDKLEISKKIKQGDPGEEEDEKPSDMAGSKDFLTPSAAEAYVFKAAPGKISNSLAPDKQKVNILPDSTMQMMQQMTAIMGDANYKTVLVLPKPAKKYTGTKPELSADKKTVTFTNNLTDLMQTPSLAEFNVEY